MLHKTDPAFRRAVSSKTLVEADLDWCGLKDDKFYFCKACYGMILQSKIPKFGSVNAVSMSTCQSYPMILKDLTSVEEAVIARAHPVISIMKLRTSGASRFISYQRIRGHAVVLPQNPGLLLDILPSSSLVLHDVIRIVWASKRPHTVEDIYPFARIRRDKVLLEYSLSSISSSSALQAAISTHLRSSFNFMPSTVSPTSFTLA